MTKYLDVHPLYCNGCEWFREVDVGNAVFWSCEHWNSYGKPAKNCKSAFGKEEREGKIAAQKGDTL
jgi:hypothetical protein